MSKKNQNVNIEVIDINETESTPEDRRGKTLTLLWFLMYLVCIISVCLVIITFVVQRSVVDGSSMETTLQDKDSVLVGKLSYTFGKPSRYDVIVFVYDNANDVNYVKRVIGLPGETVQIVDGYVYINGAKLSDDTYCTEAIKDAGIASEPLVLGEGEYFVLGDNRNASQDSRSELVGVVHKDQIIGRVICRLFPIGKFGSVK